MIKKTASKLLLAISALAIPSVMANDQFVGYIDNLDSPTGGISVSTQLVQLDPGEDFNSPSAIDKRIPEISWNINYPQLLYVPGEGATRDTLMTVKLIGVQFSHGTVSSWYRVNNGSWKKIATYSSVSYNDASQRPVLENQVFIPQGAELDFAVRSDYFNRVYIQSSSPDNIQLVRSGDELPTVGSYDNQINVIDMLASYMDGGVVDVGSRQNFLLLAEAYSSNPDSSTFDLQDMLLAVEFQDVEAAQ